MAQNSPEKYFLRKNHCLVAPDRYTLKKILQEIETIFALREFLPANIAVPALETATVGRSDGDRHSAAPSLRS